MSNQELKNYRQDDEISLGEFFDLIGKLFSKFANAVERGLKKIRHTAIYLIYFTVKKWLIFLLFVLVGTGLQYYALDKTIPVQKISEPGVSEYSASMLLSPKFGLSNQLKSDINYYNRLLKIRDYKSLAKDLNIDLSFAQGIKRFELREKVLKMDLDSVQSFRLKLITNFARIPKQIGKGVLDHLINSNPRLLETLKIEKEILENREDSLRSLLFDIPFSKKTESYYRELRTIQEKRLSILNPVRVYAHFPKLAEKVVKRKPIIVIKGYRKKIPEMAFCSALWFYLFFGALWLLKYIKSYTRQFEQ